MKKKYIVPTLEITLVAPDAMMAISDVSGADGLGVGGNTGEEGILSGNTKESGNWSDIWE